MTIRNEAISYRPDIDGLRAIAVFLVILYHLNIPILSGGYIGVDVFFVISGYLITSIILKEIDRNEFSLLKFYQRRIRRILPALFVVIIATFMVSMLLMLHHERVFLSKSIIASIFSFSNIFFWRELGYFDGGADENPLLHTWSLSVEEQFYLLFPILLIITCNYLRSKLNIVLCSLFFISFVISVFLSLEKPTAAFYLPISRAYELLAGAILAANAISLPKYFNKYSSLIGIILIFFSALLYSKSTAFPGVAGLLPVIGACLIIVSKSKNTTTTILSKDVSVYFGKISYSMYLWHWPIIVLLKYYLMRPLSMVECGVVILMIILLSHISYTYVEVAFRRNRKQSSEKRDLLSAFATSFLLIAFPLLVINNQGFPNEKLNNIVSVSKELNEQKSSVCNFTVDQRGTEQDILEYCLLSSAKLSDDKKDRNILLWGDSYANHYKSTIINGNYFPSYNIYGVSKFSCPPYYGIKGKSELDDDKCWDFNNYVLDNLKSFDKIIISANWWSYSRDPSFIDNVYSLMKAVSDKGIEIIFLGVSPVYHTRIPHIIARDMLYGDGDLDRYQIEFDQSLDTQLKSVVTQFGNYYSLYNLLCDNSICRFRDENGAYHIDNGHLSKYGAKVILDSFGFDNSGVSYHRQPPTYSKN